VRVPDEQAVLAGNRVRVISADAERTAAGDGQVCLGKQRGVGLIYIRGGVGVLLTIAERVRGAFRQDNDDFIRLFDINGSAACIADTHAVQNQAHGLLDISLYHNLTVVQVAVQAVGSGGGNVSRRALDHHAAASRDDRAALQVDQNFIGF